MLSSCIRKSILGSIPVTVIGVTILCCLLPVSIVAIKDFTFNRCIRSYAKELTVQPTSAAVTKKLFETITPQLSSDMTAEEVQKKFNEIVRSEFYRLGSTLDGGSHELVTLFICPGVGLDTILIDFSKDGNFVKAIMYFGD